MASPQPTNLFNGICQLDSSGENFWLWSLQLRTYAETFDGRDILLRACIDPSDTDPNTATARKKDAKLRLAILNTCPIPVTKLLRHRPTSSAMYSYLQTEHGEKDLNATYTEFHNLQLSDYASIEEFVERYKEVLYDLKHLDGEMSKEFVCGHFLKRVRGRYPGFVERREIELVCGVEVDLKRLMDGFVEEEGE